MTLERMRELAERLKARVALYLHLVGPESEDAQFLAEAAAALLEAAGKLKAAEQQLAEITPLYHACRGQLLEAEQRAEKAEADAKRYQHLRKSVILKDRDFEDWWILLSWEVPVGDIEHIIASVPPESLLDASIDAARQGDEG